MALQTYLLIKVIHIISSSILVGTGLGIAFFMFRSKYTDHLHEKFYACRNTVLADKIFTLPAVIIQPLTGVWLLMHLGYQWHETWLVASYVIYVVAGLCWLPVVWIQIQLKQMVHDSIDKQQTLPKRYHKLFKLWFILGWPAFLGLLIVFYLMVTKPI